jgi:hypothetical protein
MGTWATLTLFKRVRNRDLEAVMRFTPEPEPPGTGEITGASRLRAEICSRSADPYLVTVTSDAAPHCGTATVTWGAPDGELTVAPVPRTWAQAQAAGYRRVSLLWPPAEPGGYSLIIDGTGSEAADRPALTVTVTRAILHRRGPAAADRGSPCGSDCLPLIG